VLRDSGHSAASFGTTILLLTLLDGHPLRVHGRAACAGRRGAHRDGSADHRGAGDRMMVPAATAFHVDVLIDVDAVGAAASDVAGTGIRTTAAAASTTTGRGASAPTATTTATTTTATTAAATTAPPGISVRGHGEAGQNEGGHRRRKQLAE
jgi:hypothetical protein